MSRLRQVSLRARLSAAALPRGPVRRDERGDVPGWVLITLMTAGLVAVLWGVAQDQLVALFQEALASVRQ